jgi:hypothetical protein
MLRQQSGGTNAEIETPPDEISTVGQPFNTLTTKSFNNQQSNEEAYSKLFGTDEEDDYLEEGEIRLTAQE